MENKNKEILFMAIAGIGLYLFFKKKSTIAPVVPPTTGGGSELQPIAPSPVYEAPIDIIKTPVEPSKPSPIDVLPILSNPILDIIGITPIQSEPSPITPSPAPIISVPEPIYEAPVYNEPEPIYEAPVYSKPEPIYEAPVYSKPEPIYNEPIESVPVELPQFRSPIMDVISPILPSLPVESTPPPIEYFPIYEPTPIYQPAPIYWEPSPVFYEPTPIYQPEPTPVYQLEPIIVGNPPQVPPIDEPLPPSAYLEEYRSINDPNYFYIPEQKGAGSGGLFDFLNSQVWLGNLSIFQAESYQAVDSIKEFESDQA